MTVPQLYTVIVLAVLGVAICAWQVRRALREPSERDRIVTAARWRAHVVHDVGPDAARLLEDLDAHLDAHFARLAPLFEELGPPPADPDGFDRLRTAIHEHREETDR